MGSRKKTSGSFEQIAYRFFGIPSDRDAVFEKQTFGCCRYLWNRMLGDHNTLYREIGYVPQNTPADYKDLDECYWLQDADSSALANVQLNLETAFSRFYKQISKYPKFKSKKSGRNSYTTSASYLEQPRPTNVGRGFR